MDGFSHLSTGFLDSEEILDLKLATISKFGQTQLILVDCVTIHKETVGQRTIRSTPLSNEFREIGEIFVYKH